MSRRAHREHGRAFSHVTERDGTRGGSKTSASGCANWFYCVSVLTVLTILVQSVSLLQGFKPVI